MLRYSYWMDFFYYLVICKCISTTVRVNDTAWFGTFEWHFLLCHEIEYYHCHKLWFAHCNPCNVIFSSLKLGNGLKKYVWNVARIKYGFVELVVILFLLVTLNHKTWCFLIALCSLIVRRPNLEVATKRLLHQQVKIMGTVLMPCCAWNCVPETISGFINIWKVTSFNFVWQMSFQWGHKNYFKGLHLMNSWSNFLILPLFWLNEIAISSKVHNSLKRKANCKALPMFEVFNLISLDVNLSSN